MGAEADRLDIAELPVRYALAIDRKDWPALAAIFTDDARYQITGREPVFGPQGPVGICSAALEPLTFSQHIIGTTMVQLAGDEATISSYFHAQHVLEGTPGGDWYIVAGTYTDRAVRTAAGWKLAERDVTAQWTEGNPRVMQRDPLG